MKIHVQVQVGAAGKSKAVVNDKRESVVVIKRKSLIEVAIGKL